MKKIASRTPLACICERSTLTKRASITGPRVKNPLHSEVPSVVVLKKRRCGVSTTPKSANFLLLLANEKGKKKAAVNIWWDTSWHGGLTKKFQRWKLWCPLSKAKVFSTLSGLSYFEMMISYKICGPKSWEKGKNQKLLGFGQPLGLASRGCTLRFSVS